MAETVWNVPTHQPEGESSGRTLSAQTLGENALLSRAAMECSGTLARCLGVRFAANGRLLRTVLMPLLERLGDPCLFVVAAAAAAVDSVTLHCGYGSLAALAAANADYIVDGTCRQLRDLERHPRYPASFCVCKAAHYIIVANPSIIPP